MVAFKPTPSDEKEFRSRPIAKQIKFFQYLKSYGGSTVSAAVSRNKREGFYIADRGLQRAEANRRLMRTGKPHVVVRTGGSKS